MQHLNAEVAEIAEVRREKRILSAYLCDLCGLCVKLGSLNGSDYAKAAAAWRRMTWRVLPLVVLGNSRTNSISRGYL